MQKPPDLDENGNPIEVKPPDLDDNGNPQLMNFATVNDKPIDIGDESDNQPSLLSRGYQKLMEPLLSEADTSGSESLLGSGINVGENTPLIRNIWPGGIHIPGAKEIYNELIRPMSAPIGLGMMGLEGAINRGGLSRVPKTAEVGEAKPTAVPELVRPELPIEQTKRLALPPAGSIQQQPTRSLISPSADEPFLGTGQPAELLHRNKLNPASEILGEVPKISLDSVKASEPPKTPIETVLPKPGQAKSFSDISPLTANVTSADQTLASREITKPIADTIIKAQDEKTAWIAQTERELADLSKDLNKKDRVVLGILIDGQEIANAPPEIRLRAEQARTILDSVHEMFPEGATKAGENVGYLENYFTHIQHQPDDIRSAVNSIMEHHYNVVKAKDIIEPVVSGQEGLGDFFNRGMGNPSSPFVEKRTGQQHEINYDVNKVFPAYIESAARVIFDKPAVESATKMLRDIPDSNLKELATWYIKNYSRYDSEAGLHKAWNQWANTVGRITARSLLGFNTGLQTLHLARIPANLWPELGTKYTLFGLRKIANNPIQSWTEAAKLGLLQNEIRPYSFRTPMEKFDSISNFLSFADYLDKTAGYFGYKEKFTKELGMPENEASLAAIRETKKVSQTSDPARQMKLMSPKSNIAGGEVVSKLGWQFKQVPAKIVEQYINIARKAKDNPQQAARLMAGIGIVLGANEGMRTFHIDPAHMIPTGVFGAFGDTAYRIANLLSKGDWEGALKETILWATPGGKSIERQLRQGPSAFQS